MSDIDYILTSIVGDGGWAQWRIVACSFTIGLSAGIPLLLHMFAAFTPNHYCEIPTCSKNDTNWKSFALPSSSKSSNFLASDKEYSSCHSYEWSGIGCTPEDFDDSKKIQCESFSYDTIDFSRTLTTEFDLVCDLEYQRRFLGTIMMMGLMIGSLLGGKLGDHYGRKKTTFAAICIISPSVILGGYAPEYYSYLILRLITCTFLPPIWVCMHSIMMEVVGPSQREKITVVKDTFWPITCALLAFLSYFVRDYTHLHLTSGLLAALPLLTWYFVPESVRWQASNGRVKEAKKTLEWIGSTNKKTISPEQSEEISKILDKIAKEANHDENEGKFHPWDIFRFSQLKITIILMFHWITTNLSSYTLTLNATTLSGNTWLNFALVSLGELPMSLIMLFTLKYLARRTNLFLYQFLLGVMCISLAFIPKDINWLVILIYLVGKSLSGACFVLVWLIPVELYPTNLRAQALGTLSTVARIFGLTSSFVATLAKFWKPLPMLVLGVPIIIASFSAFLLPETAKQELIQNIKKKPAKENGENAPFV